MGLPQSDILYLRDIASGNEMTTTRLHRQIALHRAIDPHSARVRQLEEKLAELWDEELMLFAVANGIELKDIQ